MNDEILQPIDAYKDVYEQKHRRLTEEYFDDLVKQSGVSAEQNADYVNKRNAAEARLNSAKGTLGNYKGLRVFLIVCVVLLLFVALICGFAFATGNSDLFFLAILIPCVAVALAGGLLAIIFTVIKNKLSESNIVVDKYQKEVRDWESKAWKQMRTLNDKYDWNVPDNLIYQTVPHIRLDKYFDENKLEYFRKYYKLNVRADRTSVFSIKSGNSDGNPFLLAHYLHQDFIKQIYTGTRLVSWTETETDSDGHMRTVTHSETLVAHYAAPKPDYRCNTYLYYGCDAAPDLCFSRTPVVPQDADDKKIDSLVKSGAKRLDKKARQAINDGSTYNQLANSEFEVLFGAENRNNEVQFRLMFTPLAQQNTIKLLRSGQPYGDDFVFDKQGRVSVICSRHGAALPIDANPVMFTDYDLQNARKRFVDFNVNYFRSLYFDFAPIFCIPLYTQERCDPPYGECLQHGDIGDWEAEAIVNKFDQSLLTDPASATEAVIKAKITDKTADRTLAEVTAYSFRAVPQIEEIPVHCRNGNTYLVPVHWTDYIPVSRTSTVELQATDITREQYLSTADAKYNTSVFVSGIIARLLND